LLFYLSIDILLASFLARSRWWLLVDDSVEVLGATCSDLHIIAVGYMSCL